MDFRDDVVERALRTGEHQGLLEDYFGPENYAELRSCSREVAARGVRGGPKVLILPGIMGSKIGIRRKLPLIDNVYWFDPFDIAAGHLTRLALGAGPSRFQALGVILLAYLRIKLKLDASGYDADFYPFDWRQSIARLGNDLRETAQGAGWQGGPGGSQHGRPRRSQRHRPGREVPPADHAGNPELRIFRAGDGAPRYLSGGAQGRGVRPIS